MKRLDWVLLKVDERTECPRLDFFGLQAAIQPLQRRRKKDQIITTAVGGRWQRTLAWGSFQQPSPYDQMLTTIITKASGHQTGQRILKPRGAGPWAPEVVIRRQSFFDWRW